MDIRVKQRDLTDCGAACLASVARHYKLNLPLMQIRQRAGTDKSGTNVLGLVEAAESYGFEARGVKGTAGHLFDIPLPAIAHVVVGDSLQHFVVIYSISKSKILIMDPADGEVHRKAQSEFLKVWSGVLVLFAPPDIAPLTSKAPSMSLRMWRIIYPHRLVLIQCLAGALVYTLLGLSTAVFIQQIIDEVFLDTNFSFLNLLALLMLVVLMIRTTIDILKDIFILKTGQIIDSRLILGYYRHLLKLPQHFLNSMKVGEMTSRINDAIKIRLFINDVAINLVVGLFMLIASLALMFGYYWKLAAIIVLIVPIYGLIFYVTNKLNKRSQRSVMESAAEMESQLVESLNAISTVKRLSLEKHFGSKAESKFALLLQRVYASGMNALFSSGSTEFISQLFTIILLWVGAGFVIRSEITPGELLSFYTLIGYFTTPVSSFITLNRSAQDASIAADRLFEMMDVETEVGDGSDKLDLDREMLGNIRFNEVSFRYSSRALVFSNLTLEISLRSLTGVVGESGSGKSTLASLIHQIYTCQSGNIYIGDRALTYFTNHSIRNVVAVVPQEIHLFSGSILENITIGNGNSDMKKVLLLCNQLGLTTFIEGLADGFHSQIGENGAALSGGQRQRIAIARALYRDPEILILDEATSSLDGQSENFVEQALKDFLSQGKTVIMIAHRLKIISKAQKIIVLKEGRVVEEGSHDELLMLRSAYYELWNKSNPDNEIIK